jgi:DNA-binding transcriptional regulator YiaG
MSSQQNLTLAGKKGAKMDEQEKLNGLQNLLTEAYLAYVTIHKRRKVGDNEFARYLGVNVGSFNQWINGNRSPDYSNVLRMAPNLAKLDPEYGRRIFDVLGYDRVTVINDPEVQFISFNWRKLSESTRREIIEHIKEETARKEVLAGA